MYPLLSFFRFVPLLISGTLISSCTLGQTEKYDNSILWSIHSEKTGKTSYILGTQHIIDTTRVSFPIEKVKSLIDKCQYLWLEIDAIQRSRANFLTSKYLTADPEAPKLPGCLSHGYQKKLQRILDSAKYTLPLLKSSLPELKPQGLILYLFFENLAKSYSGYVTTAFAPETFFERYAKSKNKGVISLESANDQIQWLINPDLEFSEAVKQLEISIDHFFDEQPDLEKVYSSQDINQMAAPFLIDSLMISRNLNMAKRLDFSLQDYSVFVLVGAAHLAGENGILHLLENKGYSIRPVQVQLELKESIRNDE